jgi:hypothetical protein
MHDGATGTMQHGNMTIIVSQLFHALAFTLSLQVELKRIVLNPWFSRAETSQCNNWIMILDKICVRNGWCFVTACRKQTGQEIICFRGKPYK